jgi:hypothetical protein
VSGCALAAENGPVPGFWPNWTGSGHLVGAANGQRGQRGRQRRRVLHSGQATCCAPWLWNRRQPFQQSVRNPFNRVLSECQRQHRHPQNPYAPWAFVMSGISRQQSIGWLPCGCSWRASEPVGMSTGTLLTGSASRMNLLSCCHRSRVHSKEAPRARSQPWEPYRE